MHRALLSSVVLAWVAFALMGCNNPPKEQMSAAERGEGPAAPNVIDPKADKALREMCNLLADAKAITFRSSAQMDEEIETGQFAEVPRNTEVMLRRPDMLHVVTQHGGVECELWHRDHELTILRKNDNLYATTDVPSEIPDMLDELYERYGMEAPVADLLFPKPYDVLTENVLAGTYVGLETIGGVKCHHLFFTQDAVDWQIWIQAGDKPLPCKLVIDYKQRPGRPQFMATFRDWSLFNVPHLQDELFDAKLPENAKKVEMADLFGQGGKK